VKEFKRNFVVTRAIEVLLNIAEGETTRPPAKDVNKMPQLRFDDRQDTNFTAIHSNTPDIAFDFICFFSNLHPKP
jgi:hypothetical protein